MESFLNQTYFDNTILQYIIAAAIFLILILLILIFKKVVLGRIKKWTEKTDTKIDDFVLRGIEKSIVPLLYFGAFYAGLKSLELPPRADKWISIISVIVVTFFVIRILTASLKFALNSYLVKRSEDGEVKAKQFSGLTLIASSLLWIFGFVFLLDNLGFDVTTVIAGLGIGGIAIALAAQTILGDLFSYFVIFFDKPFQIGDFVVVGDKMGNVEYIGLKTTRIRALSGEQLVFSNTDLTNSRIHNFKKMERRRVVFKLGVIYQTTAEQLEQIPQIVKQIIEEQPDTQFDRAHFANYGDFSLNFEFVYYVLSSEYNKFMDTQQEINLKIYREFEAKGIEFAYPTQTVMVSRTES